MPRFAQTWEVGGGGGHAPHGRSDGRSEADYGGEYTVSRKLPQCASPPNLGRNRPISAERGQHLVELSPSLVESGPAEVGLAQLGTKTESGPNVAETNHAFVDVGPTLVESRTLVEPGPDLTEVR